MGRNEDKRKFEGPLEKTCNSVFKNHYLFCQIKNDGFACVIEYFFRHQKFLFVCPCAFDFCCKKKKTKKKNPEKCKKI